MTDTEILNKLIEHLNKRKEEVNQNIELYKTIIKNDINRLELNNAASNIELLNEAINKYYFCVDILNIIDDYKNKKEQ